MTAINFERVRAFAYIAEAQYGKLGLIGIALVAASLVGLVLVTIEGVRDHRKLRQDIVRLQKEAAIPQSAQSAAEGPFSVDSQLPTRDDLSGILAQLSQEAQDRGLTIASADYVWSAKTASSLSQYQISFTLHAGYLPIREFVRAILDAEPAIALREMSFTRDAPTRPDLVSKLSFVIFVSENAK